MSRQKIVDLVHDHYIVKKNKPGHNGKYCSLRGDDDTRCAIGLLLPDEEYGEFAEEMMLPDLIRESPTLRQIFPHVR
jgi:hypothetical protein